MVNLPDESPTGQQSFDDEESKVKPGPDKTRFRQHLAIIHPMIRKGWPVWLVSLVTFLNGAWSIASIVLTRIPQRIRYFLPFGIEHWTRLLSLVIGFLLVYLSFHLFQRRRTAWWVALLATGLIIFAHSIHPRMYYTVLPDIATFALLLIFQARFTVRSESRNIKLGLILLLSSLLVALLYGTFGFLTLGKKDFGMTFPLHDAFVRSLRQFSLLGNADLVPRTRQARWFLDSLNTISIVAIVFALYSLFRPIVYRFAQHPREQARASAIVEKHGNSTFDYFKAWPDKWFFFSKTNQSFIAYRTISGVAFCLADPVGPANEKPELISQFLSYCEQNGWITAFMMPDDPAPYAKIGLSLLKIGEEATVDLDKFCSHTINEKYFRYIHRKLEGDGFRVTRYKPPLSPEVLQELTEITRLWLRLPHHREYGFFQGRFDRAYLEKCTVAILRNRDGKGLAFVNEVPSYRAGEATFDMMRHVPGLHWGTMDYLFSQEMVTLHNEGYRSFNFGVAPFVGIGDRPDATLTEKTVNQIFERLDWFVHSKGLRQYKLKFDPEWKDSFVAYQGGPLGLMRIGLNINRLL